MIQAAVCRTSWRWMRRQLSLKVIALIQKKKMIRTCISCLLLHIKQPTISWLKTYNLYFSFCGSGVQVWFNRVPFSRSHKAASKVLAGLHSFMELGSYSKLKRLMAAFRSL